VPARGRDVPQTRLAVGVVEAPARAGQPRGRRVPATALRSGVRNREVVRCSCDLSLNSSYGVARSPGGICAIAVVTPASGGEPVEPPEEVVDRQDFDVAESRRFRIGAEGVEPHPTAGRSRPSTTLPAACSRPDLETRLVGLPPCTDACPGPASPRPHGNTVWRPKSSANSGSTLSSKASINGRWLRPTS